MISREKTLHMEQPTFKVKSWRKETAFNPKSTEHFASGTALGGWGCFPPPPSVKLDPDILES